MREPLLINSIGHSVGLLLFAGFLILVLRDRRRGQSARSLLPIVTATLALLWNAGSLIALAASSGLFAISEITIGLNFAVLSLIPATLLQLSLEGKARPVWIAGYALSGVAVALHLAELVSPRLLLHEAALWVIIIGFAALTVIATFAALRSSPTGRIAGRRVAVSMCLLLFAISFIHFSSGHAEHAWSSEIALHHAGIPLALYVLLQDYRFLLLDAFVRFLANSVVASAFIVSGFLLDQRFHILRRAAGNSFLLGTLLVAACLILIAAIAVRGKLQLLLTRVVFRRPDREPAIASIRAAGSLAASEQDFLEKAADWIATFAGAARREIRSIDSWHERRLPAEPALAAECNLPYSEPWAEACVPARFMKGDGILILLGRREGGRRYLSEDLQELARLSTVVVEQVERLRNSEIQRLVSQAELRALQSQINPHFLFNSLNTLYGSIPRQAAEARRMVLNLADIFRYFLQNDRTFIPLAGEMQIVNAYLEIEALRLGDKLRTEIDVDESALQTLIPVLSVQPLIENAVKHGVAARSKGGTVRLRARSVPQGVSIEIGDDGAGFRPAGTDGASTGQGVGLDNVRQRLKLCFGDQARLEVLSTDHGTTVSVLIPCHRTPVAVKPQEVSI